MSVWISGNSYNNSKHIEKFRLMHCEIIENYQCIEFDMRRIYSAMVEGDAK